jgi:glycine betaine catabolism B
MNVLHKIDNFLNNFTMYRVILYGLIIMVFNSIIFGIFGIIPYDGFSLLISSLILTAACYLTNHIFARIFKATVNIESSFITALLLFFLMQPIDDVLGALLLVAVGTIAMASKYILALNKKHIFNPVAIAALVLSFNPYTLAIWWVGTPVMLPITIIVGFLTVRKIRRFNLFFSYLIAAYFSILLFAYLNNVRGIDLFTQQFTSWPLIYFGAFMLTEPLTTPPTKKLQIIYGILVGILFGMPLNLGVVYSSPELALVIGNIFSHIVSPKKNLLLKLSEKIKLAPDIYGFKFKSDQQFNFIPGQYLEWTLPHHNPDSRGNRRYFTIASSPQSQEIELGVKISENSSSYKKALQSMNLGDKLFASHLSGDFTLNEAKNEKLVFIAGGIGVTPFKSIIEYLNNSKQKKDVTLMYACADPSEFVYKELFENAGNQIGLKTIYVLTRPENAPKDWTGKTGRINEQMIREEIPDFKDRAFFLSGPNAMVQGYKQLLASLGIPKNQIITDYFPGF